MHTSLTAKRGKCYVKILVSTNDALMPSLVTPLRYGVQRDVGNSISFEVTPRSSFLAQNMAPCETGARVGINVGCETSGKT